MNFFWIEIIQSQYKTFLDLMKNPVKKTLVFTPNPEILLRASRDKVFADILKQATYNTPDAIGLYVGSLLQQWKSFLWAIFSVYFLRTKIQNIFGDLIKGSDLTSDLLEFSQSRKLSILILDKEVKNIVTLFDKRKQETQIKLKQILESKYPWIHVHVFLLWEISYKNISEYIRNKHIQYVFSCLWMKEQEEVLIKIFSYLPEEQKVVWLGVGASIDFLLGLQRRAPKIFQKLGLEWLYRLIMQPKIRAKRIWNAVYHFPKLVKKSSNI